MSAEAPKSYRDNPLMIKELRRPKLTERDWQFFPRRNGVIGISARARAEKPSPSMCSVISPQHEHTWVLGHRKSGRDGSVTNAVAVARPVLQDVDVQVLGMRRIGPWAEYRCEPPACGDADGIDRATQMFIPIRFDGQYFAIRELEARDVHRQTGRVRADLAGLCAVAVAAFVTRPRVNRLEFDRELAGNERSDEIAQPMAEPFTELTGKRRLFG